MLLTKRNKGKPKQKVHAIFVCQCEIEQDNDVSMVERVIWEYQPNREVLKYKPQISYHVALNWVNERKELGKFLNMLRLLNVNFPFFKLLMPKLHYAKNL